MDKNTLIGLILIGLILSVFTIYNKPSDQNKIEDKHKESSVIELKDTNDNVSVESITNDTFKKDTINNRPKVKDSIITMENDKLIIDFNTMGGQISSVRLKEFETYKNYAKNDKNIEPLIFFNKGDASNGLILPMFDGSNLNTVDEIFNVKYSDNSTIVFELRKGEKQSVEFSYELKPNNYNLDYSITLNGFEDKLKSNDILFNWSASLRKTERSLSEQRRVSTICFKYKEEGFDWLNEMSDGDLDSEDKVDWISFKQSYFSSFINPKNEFEKAKFIINTYKENHPKEWTHLKDFSTTATINLSNLDNNTYSMDWFFGPNDYELLTSYNDSYDDVLNYGWGIFRWINIYAVQPIFNVLKSTGMGVGIAILILTLIIKFMLMPIQWKMYTSSAKMKILKPEIQAINEKYPDKSDAMKKQMETMSLYRESGASPLSGCIPMLIQMPILLAVFRFFPSTFDLRQKSFLWAEDLSSYDSIATIPNIPFYGDHISLFTLLMAITTLIYSHFNSSQMQQPSQPGMPNMKIIMYFFPIMMIFFFNNYSSGLSYYYFISTLTSILIMILIKKFFVDEDKIKLKMANRKANASINNKKGRKSKFQERLEKMQKAQQEAIMKRNRKK